MSTAPRPRYGRIAAFSLAVLVTVTAVLAGVGAPPHGTRPGYAARSEGDPAGAISLSAGPHSTRAEEALEAAASASLDLPPDSGEGRRVVFDMSEQRVWLVKRDGSVRRTYLVSGSRYDNLSAGTYEVYSRSRRATGIDESGTMRYMVRFTVGDNAPIGFHDIPVLDGEPVQSRDELGTPLSHGCVRQWRTDAKAMWRFAKDGTSVVVTD